MDIRFPKTRHANGRTATTASEDLSRRHFVTSGGRVHCDWLVKHNKIKVVARYYDVTNGVVALLD